MEDENKAIQNEKDTTEATPAPTDVDAHAASDMVAKANEAAERMEAANREHARLLQKEEQLKVEHTLGGQAAVSATKKAEETPKEYAARVMANE